MDIEIPARQRMLSTSDCRQLCGRPVRDIVNLATRTGWHGMSGQPVSVSVASALNMLVMSIAMDNNVEPQAMTKWLPGLRNEALLKLGEDTSNWYFEGSTKQETDFFSTLYGGSEVTRPTIARLLGCDRHGTIAQLRFYSQVEVECIAPGAFEPPQDRIPRFVIEAQSLANRIRATCGGTLFTVKAKSPF